MTNKNKSKGRGDTDYLFDEVLRSASHPFSDEKRMDV